MTKVPMCPQCDDPLVETFAFSGFEFFCLACGGLFGFLDPIAKDETPELLARMEKLRERWLPIGRDLLTGGVMKADCLECFPRGEAHIRHASPEELSANLAAIEKVKAIREGGSAC